jgi:hypothetical protein
MGVDQPSKWPYLLQKKKSLKSKGTGEFIRRQLPEDILFSKKCYKFYLFLGIWSMEPSPLLFVPPRAYQTLG